LGGLLTIYVGYLTISGVIAGSVDAVTLKSTKLAISGIVPVVGSVIADAAETIAASASIIKNTIGIAGMLGVLAICVVPFLRLGAQYLIYKLTGTICSVFSDKRLSDLVVGIAGAFGIILGMAGACALLLMISMASAMIASTVPDYAGFIKNWIVGVTAAAMIAAIVQSLAPEGPVRKTLRLAFGVLMILAVLRPVKELNLEDFSFYRTQYDEGLSQYTEKMNEVSKSFTRSIIEEKTGSYILEKADELQIPCEVSVKLKTNREGGYPYPFSVELTVSGYPEEEKKEALSRFIESQCAIPKDRQKWVYER
jgi:hypothetical protein